MRSLCRPGFLLFFLLISLPRVAASDVLRRVVIGDTAASVMRLAQTAGSADAVRSSLPLFQGREFRDVLDLFFGRPMDRAQLQALGEAVADYARGRDFPVVKVHLPDFAAEELPPGTVGVIVTLGRYGAVSLAGQRFSNRERFLRELGVAAGGEVRLSALGAGIDWVNTNPFREVDAVLRDEGDGRAGLELQLREQRPYRAIAAYDNYGTVYTGRSRYTAAIQAGDLWQAGHQFYYEFTRTRAAHHYQAHTGEYRVPLPWRGYLIAEAAYSAVRPDLTGTSFTAEGRNFIGALRHVLHHRVGRWTGEWSAGVTFKAIRNNLEFGGAPYLVDGRPFQDFHIYQLSLGESLRRSDARGSWWLAVNASLSPGGVDARNGDGAVRRSRTGAEARYGYAICSVQRLTTLSQGWQLRTRALGQLSTGRLLASEQLWLGGAATLRGYPERAYPGDAAWAATQELRSPALSCLATFLGAGENCRIQALSFVDAGRSYLRRPTADEVAEPMLLSFGVGLRGNVGRRFDFAFDYGWPLRRSSGLTSAPGGCGQIQVRLCF